MKLPEAWLEKKRKMLGRSNECNRSIRFSNSFEIAWIFPFTVASINSASFVCVFPIFECEKKENKVGKGARRNIT